MMMTVALTFDDVRSVPSVVIAIRVHLGDIPGVERGRVVEHSDGLGPRANFSMPATYHMLTQLGAYYARLPPIPVGYASKPSYGEMVNKVRISCGGCSQGCTMGRRKKFAFETSSGYTLRPGTRMFRCIHRDLHVQLTDAHGCATHVRSVCAWPCTSAFTPSSPKMLTIEDGHSFRRPLLEGVQNSCYC
jgi:hypothetical protein